MYQWAIVLRRELSKIQLRLLSFKTSSNRKLTSDSVSNLGNVFLKGLELTVGFCSLCPQFADFAFASGSPLSSGRVPSFAGRSSELIGAYSHPGGKHCFP